MSHGKVRQDHVRINHVAVTDVHSRRLQCALAQVAIGLLRGLHDLVQVCSSCCATETVVVVDLCIIFHHLVLGTLKL